ncbi:hypothetical protein DS909_09785 [Phaeobacter gallaeciensis]|uniref:Uncharacterized protein n=1 Tax=Phaeobacter gallaeciensis TaxID=60890 RepID=A0A366X1V1_9RHOB|nr:hypothetical protein [Phaeobacter gallaeciensis]RBW55913.1 hypothetical protein DS909_09785 [Phaeobacter gallaeciensis]
MFDQDPESATIELLVAIKLNPDGGTGKTRTKRPHSNRVTLVGEDSEPGLLDSRDNSFQTVLATDLRGLFRALSRMASHCVTTQRQ